MDNLLYLQRAIQELHHGTIRCLHRPLDVQHVCLHQFDGCSDQQVHVYYKDVQFTNCTLNICWHIWLILNLLIPDRRATAIRNAAFYLPPNLHQLQFLFYLFVACYGMPLYRHYD